MPGSWYGLAPTGGEPDAVTGAEALAAAGLVGAVAVVAETEAAAVAAAVGPALEVCPFPQPASAGARNSTVAPIRTAAARLAKTMGRVWDRL
ncbi:hypothetical protein GCM10018966_059900 [Streptomyces yanii]